ncbi:MAG: 4-hydroxy-3-methylbut-2-enyl diphosphate reductase [Sulfurovum sp. FS08-3]|nr:MAG: 4-hydroxy-3-methylbut-2-enyl diphosphate reductase [Sulfurovum sp. FS08-3]
MKIQLASSYGFCYGVKRAIEIAQHNPNSKTYGPLIHNKDEISRLKQNYNIDLATSIDELRPQETVIIRTHGITKDELQILKKQNNTIINATCPYVTKPQQIVEQMSKEGYSVVIFGDKDHPEIKGVYSYGQEKNTFIVNTPDDIDFGLLKSKVAVVSQTTRKPQDFEKIVNALTSRIKEVRVFNTICNATFENQDAAMELAQEADIMIVIGGKHSSNTKQLHSICKSYCKDSFLIENESEIVPQWFEGKSLCGISAGASTPDWIVQNVINTINQIA